VRLPDRVRVKPVNPAVRLFHLAIKKGDGLVGRGIGDVKIAVAFSVFGEDLDEFIALDRDGGVPAEYALDVADQDDGGGIRIFRGVHRLDFFPGGRGAGFCVRRGSGRLRVLFGSEQFRGSAGGPERRFLLAGEAVILVPCRCLFAEYGSERREAADGRSRRICSSRPKRRGRLRRRFRFRLK